MSEEIQAAEERASDGEEEPAGGNEERIEIYENQEVWEHRLLPKKKRSCFCLSGFLLGMLYVLVLAWIYTRYIFATFDGQNLAAERDQLNSSLHEHMIRLNELNQTLKQLNESLNLEKARNVNLTAERDELQGEKKALKERMRDCSCGVTIIPFFGAGFPPPGLTRTREVMPVS